MLVLSRKCGERIVIPDQDIIVTVLEVRGEQVRLGIEAPSDIPIYREEVWQRIKTLTETEQPETVGAH
jgi:carbon storage regulator